MDIDEIFEDIAKGVVVLVSSAAKNYATQATDDFAAFFKDAGEDMKRYSKWYLAGELTKVEYELLIKAKTTNLKMLELSAIGIGQTRIKHLQTSVRDLILKTVFAALPG